MVGVEPRRREVGLCPTFDPDHRKAVRIEVAAQRRQEVLGIDADDKADLQVALACGGIALTGFSGLPVAKASTSKLHQPNTFSLGLSPGSPQSGSIAGDPSLPSIGQSASATRTEFGRWLGTHSRTWIAPFGVVIVANAWARMTPGLAKSPPQLPE